MDDGQLQIYMFKKQGKEKENQHSMARSALMQVNSLETPRGGLNGYLLPTGQVFKIFLVFPLRLAHIVGFSIQFSPVWPVLKIFWKSGWVFV